MNIFEITANVIKMLEKNQERIFLVIFHLDKIS